MKPLILILFSLNSFGKAPTHAAALVDLENALKNFASSNRILIEKKAMKVTYQEKKIVQKPKKIYLQTVQTLRLNLVLAQEENRLMPMTPSILAGKMKTELIQTFCRKQNYRSKEIRIAIVNPEQILRQLSQIGDEFPDLDPKSPLMTVQTVSIDTEPSTQPRSSGYFVSANCVSRKRLAPAIIAHRKTLE